MKIHEERNMRRLLEEIKASGKAPDIMEEASGLYRCNMEEYTFWFRNTGKLFLQTALEEEGLSKLIDWG